MRVESSFGEREAISRFFVLNLMNVQPTTIQYIQMKNGSLPMLTTLSGVVRGSTQNTPSPTTNPEIPNANASKKIQSKFLSFPHPHHAYHLFPLFIYPLCLNPCPFPQTSQLLYPLPLAHSVCRSNPTGSTSLLLFIKIVSKT